MNAPITFGSVCSGIEAASVAWGSLGWKAAWLAEIEPFPCAVLAHHYPAVPNLGDMTKIAAMLRARSVPAPDVLCGGTPCQAFSVAGLRRSLDDARGNLSLTFCEIANEIDDRRAADGTVPCVVFWENVPGVLNTKDNAFGCFLAGLAGEDDPLVPAGGKWTNAGCVLGPKRAVAWRVLDAQYFGVAQRRRRVFVVASAREGFDPAAVLFEFDGVRRDSAPRREAGQEPAGTLASRTDGGGFPGTDEACSGYVQPAGWPAEVAPTLNAAFGSKLGLENQHIRGGQAYLSQQELIAGGQLARCLTTKTRIDAETETLIPTIGGVFVDSSATFMADDYKDGTFEVCDTARPLTTSADRTRAAPIVAFSCKDYGADASVDLSPTMRAMGHAGSHANAGGQLAVCVTGDITHRLTGGVGGCKGATEDGIGSGQPIIAFKPGQSEAAGAFFETEEFSPTLQAQNNGSTAVPAIQCGMAVRRLTPRECERLQGFPDDYTLIPGKRIKNVKPEKLDRDYLKYLARGGVLAFEQCMSAAADGPRYKALGNSWAVPNVRWIGARIDREMRRLANDFLRPDV